MNIKSLLLGSAAALVAVSGARAADAVEVVAEPEPAEYVRICDTYGTGFYYIPGTETCLRVGGFVRYQVNVGNEFGVFFPGENSETREIVGAASDYGWSKEAIASIQLDARTETEFGTLRAYIDARTINGSTGGSVDKAFISLGGLTVGRASNAFDFGIDGEQDQLGDGTFNVIQYTFVGENGFSATVSLDDDGDVISGAGAFDSNSLDVYRRDTSSGADFMPNVSANVRYATGPLELGLYGAYDNDTEEFAAKLIAAYSFTENDKLSLGGYWQSGSTYVLGGSIQNLVAAVGDFDGDGDALFRSQLTNGGEWSVQGAYWHRFNDKLAASVGAVYTNNVGFLSDIPGNNLEADFWRVGTTIDYTVAPGFTILTNVNYNQFTGKAVDAIDAALPGDDLGDGFVSGFIRFQRDF